MRDAFGRPCFRETWLDGPPEPKPVYCPVCEDECSEVYFNANGDVVGCDNCISRQDAYEWAAEEDENAREIEAERRADARREGDLW